jgi:cell division protein FtsL
VRGSTVICGVIAIGVGAGLFQLKYEVMRLEQQYRQICQTIKASEESIHILKAEWAHLNDPKRLQQLAQKHLGIEPVGAAQLTSFERVAGRETNYDRDALEKLVADIASDQKAHSAREGE